MNGQRGRQELVRELFRTLPFELVVETGCYRGNTTEFLWYMSGVPTYSVDRNKAYAASTRRRLRHTGARIVTGDSPEFLRDLTKSTDLKALTFFYLDAHWRAELPLAEEVSIITHNWTSAVIMIDDFQVPDDEGYGFDEFGPLRLNRNYLQSRDSVGDYRYLWPSVPSGEETGYRRGCGVLVPPTLLGAALEIKGLRTLDEEGESSNLTEQPSD